jgi:hypothetical protein
VIQVSDSNDTKENHGSADRPHLESVLIPRATHSDAHEFMPTTSSRRTTGYLHDDVKDKTEFEKTQVSLRRGEKCECFQLADMKGSGFDSIDFSQIEVAIPFNMIGA